MTEENLFEILGLEPSEEYTNDEIRKAWMTKAKELHPDRGGDAEEFNKVQKAYEALVDPAARISYHKTGKVKEKVDFDKRARSTIMSMLEKILNSTGEEIFMGDAPGALFAMIEDEMNTRRKLIDQTKKAISRYKRFRDRFKSKGQNIDFIKQGFDNKIFSFKNDLKTHLEDVKVLRRMKSLLEDYEYVPEEGFSFKRWI